MAIVDVSTYIVQVGATSAGTFATIADMRSSEATHGEESETRTYVFGQTNPYVRGGADTDEYRLSGLYNIGDTNGQNVLRTAKDNDGTVFLRVRPQGTGAQSYQQECRVTQYTDSAEAGPAGNYVTVSFSLRGVGTRVNSSALGVFA
jgi:hypothetical protein